MPAMQHLPLSLAASKDPKDAPLKRQLAQIGALVAKSSKVVVVTGAGISCSCGIPDFRSEDGLYALVKARYPSTFLTGKDLFSSSVLRSPESTSIFFSFIAELKLAVDKVEPSRTHRFVRRLEEKGRLMRSYTQNIDGLEKRSGVECSSGKGEVDGKGKGKETFGSNEEAKKEDESWPPSSQASTIAPPPSSYASISASPRMDSTPSPSSPSPPLSSLPPTSSSPGPQADSVIFPSSPANLDKKTTKNVQLHGDLHKVRCTSCQTTYDFEDEFVEMMREGVAVQCPACEMKSAVRSARGQRQLAQGVLRPAIVLYDENHPSGDLIGSLQSHDLTKQPDLLLVLGTSLKVHGLKRVVKEFARAVHELSVTKARPDGGKGRVVFVNKTPPGKEWEGVFDAWVEGDCDEFVDGVEAEWRRVKKGDWEEQGKLVLGASTKTATGRAKIVKGVSTAAGAKKGKAPSRPSSAGPSRPSTPPPSVKPPLAMQKVAPSSPLPYLSSPARPHHPSPLELSRSTNLPPRFAPPPSPQAIANGALKSPKKKQKLAPSRSAARGVVSDDEGDTIVYQGESMKGVLFSSTSSSRKRPDPPTPAPPTPLSKVPTFKLPKSTHVHQSPAPKSKSGSSTATKSRAGGTSGGGQSMLTLKTTVARSSVLAAAGVNQKAGRPLGSTAAAIAAAKAMAELERKKVEVIVGE